MNTPEWYVKNSLKPPKKFFDFCYSHIPTYKWENKTTTIVSSDRTNCPLIEKRLTKSSKLTLNDTFYPFCIVLVSTKRIEIQSYGFWSEVTNGKQIVTTELIGLERLAQNEHIQVGKWWNYYNFGLAPLVPMGGPYTNITYYPNNWLEKVKVLSELKYLDYSRFTAPSVHQLPHLYKYREHIEFLQKIKATAIAEQLVRNNIDLRSMTKHWLYTNKHLLKGSTQSFETFELYRRIKQRGGKPVSGIEKHMTYKDINHIPKKARLINFQNWILKNNIDFSFYRDYLHLMKDLQIDVSSDNLITPKDLTAAHDNAVKLHTELEKEITEAQSKKRLEELARLETSIDNYSFIVPKDLNELVAEGKHLSHCVGSSNYVEGHRLGKTTIIFIRKKEQPHTPYYTMEFKDNTIKQVRGKHNQSADPHLQDITQQWLTWINSNPRKEQVA